MDIAVLLGVMFFCFVIGVPIAYSLALAAIAGAFWIGIPLEAVMLKISDGVSKVAMLTIPFFVGMLPARLQLACDLVTELLMAAMALFMLWYGAKLVDATWQNTIADFPFLSVGVTYLPIPIGGAFLLLFVIERVILGTPPDPDHAIPH